MKAFVLHAYGPSANLELADVSTPVPAADEVLVRVRATSINPYDWHYMRGEPRVARMMPGTMGLRVPRIRILGCDMAGQVEAVGKEVTRFGPGDDVFALLEQGGFAEYVSVPEHLLARKPANLSYEQAAAMPMAAVTALLSLRDVGRLQPGQKLLVNGASGGVGSFALQIARALGASADAVCSATHADLVTSIGADEAIDYAREDFSRREKRYDLLLDVAGSRPVSTCRRALTRRGTLVLVGGPAGRWLQPVGHMVSALATAPLTSQRTAIANTVTCKTKQQLLTTLAALTEDGRVTPVVSRNYPFRELRQAVQYQEQGHVAGKVTVTL